MGLPLGEYRRFEHYLLKRLETLPLIGFYAATRGWDFVLAWGHRATGILLALYMALHVYTLTSLRVPEAFAVKMRFYQEIFFVFLEWTLAIPVIFHALNGGRLILYEVFCSRPVSAITRAMMVFCFCYVGLLALMMILGNQTVSPFLFWLCLLAASVVLAYIVAVNLPAGINSRPWKLQRITGAFLLLMIPAHLFFMHLQPQIGHDAGTIIARMQSALIKAVDLALLGGGLYHAGYGLLSVVKDYLPSKFLKYCATLAILIILGLFFLAGARLTLFI